jgi:hypothetical protein
VAYIREDESLAHIVPWLERMEDVVRDKEDRPSVKDKDPRDLPQIDIPAELERKIHLYNVMLQLGIPKFFQKPLIDALVLQMYQTNLGQCHLDTLEMTIGRFYARGVAVLDPVLSHFIVTYAFRSIVNRQQPEPSEDDRILHPGPPPNDKRKDLERYAPLNTKREWLTFSTATPHRKDYPDDTHSVPPKLEVLGHSIRHWSGVRRNGSTAAVTTGYPLNVGSIKKYYLSRCRNSAYAGRIEGLN